ncbi:MAG: FtsX-like permease family protein [Alphaproteobacteria bacterium]|jgi:ABC-type lipoprotein release transport system permease subunit|nr:FtsX-like permease family protein [Alphaproteobacteria bacterium]
MLKSFLIIFNLAMRSVFSNWSKNKVIISIIIVSIMLIQILLSIAEGFRGQVKTFALDSLIGNLKIMNPQYKIDNSINNNFIISEDILQQIADMPQVKGVTRRIQVPAVFKSEREIRNGVLVGIDVNTERNLSFIGKSYDYTKFASIFKDNGILIGQELLEKLQTQKSFKIVASAQDVNDKSIESSFFISDTYKSTLPNVEEIFVFTDINTIAKIYGLGEAITEVSIVLYDDNDLATVFSAVEKIIPEHTKLYTWGDLNPFFKGWLDMMYIVLMIFFSVVFLAATIPLTNTILISVLERIHEFGIMQALGFRKMHLFVFIMSEAIIILLIGIIIGSALGLTISGILASTGINISAFSQGAANIGLGDYIYPKVDIVLALQIIFAMLFLGIIASLYPSIRAILYNPMQALSKRRN